MRNDNMVKALYQKLEEVGNLLHIPDLDDFLQSSENRNTSYDPREYFVL